jgi:hypothetical protein
VSAVFAVVASRGDAARSGQQHAPTCCASAVAADQRPLTSCVYLI